MRFESSSQNPHQGGQAKGTSLIWFSYLLSHRQLRISLLAVTGPPVDVGVTMYVLSISSVSEVLMVLNLPFYLINLQPFGVLEYIVS